VKTFPNDFPYEFPSKFPFFPCRKTKHILTLSKTLCNFLPSVSYYVYFYNLYLLGRKSFTENLCSSLVIKLLTLSRRKLQKNNRKNCTNWAFILYCGAYNNSFLHIPLRNSHFFIHTFSPYMVYDKLEKSLEYFFSIEHKFN
jgi:hypothetical protein